MGIFDFDFGKKDAPPDISADPTRPSVSGIRVEDSQSAATLREAKSTGDKKAKSGDGAFSFGSADETKVDPELQNRLKALEDLLDPKVWKGAVAAPGDAMVAITGKEYWSISEDERDTLAKTGAATARCFMVTDPKWLAFSLFGFSIISIYGARLIKDLDERKKEKENVLPHAT